MPADTSTGQVFGDAAAVRPFEAEFPEVQLVDLRRRVAATRWSERETVSNDSQGVLLALMQELARYLFSSEMRAAFRSLRRP
jgi:hypothetical protein